MQVFIPAVVAATPRLPQWKGFCLDQLEGRWDFQGCWQDTYLLGKQVGGSTLGGRRCCMLAADCCANCRCCQRCAAGPVLLPSSPPPLLPASCLSAPLLPTSRKLAEK